jgi:hypothetical protein
MSDSSVGKKSRKYGRNEAKCARYRAERRHEHNKLRRILRCNGMKAAEKWALDRDCTSILKAVIKARTAVAA